MKKLVKKVKETKVKTKKEEVKNEEINVYMSMKSVNANGKEIQYPYYIIVDREHDIAIEVSHIHHSVSNVTPIYETFTLGYEGFGFKKLR